MSLVPSTGITGTSTKLTLPVGLVGLAGAIASYIHTTPNSKVGIIAGGVLAAVSLGLKIWHDRGLHVATIETAGADMLKAIPAAESAVPALRSRIAELEAAVDALEDHVANVPVLGEIVKAVRGQIIAEADVLKASVSPASPPVAPVAAPAPSVAVPPVAAAVASVGTSPAA